jgi:phosphopentomutase
VSFRRVVWIVLDSVGIGAMPDAADYGDPPDSDTLGNVARKRPLHIPHLVSLGLGNLKPLSGISPAAQPLAAYGRCALRSPGKDTTTGHWEMVGVILDRPFPVFPAGFPASFLREFEDRIGRATLWNKPASGTEIIRLLGDEHLRTGSPIVYTSADSVFQIAAHEDVIPLWELYKICETAREMLRGELEVGRVIARPFTGEPGEYTRTANRKDYAVPPPKGMLLDQLERAGVVVHSVGKIFDIFLGRGIGPHVKTSSNADGMAKTLAAMDETREGLIFTNLVDFDSLYGHRNDVEGYARALEEADAWIPSLIDKRQEGDLILLTADHGCDPTTASTDHSREYVPLLAHGGRAADLGTRDSLADIGQTVAENFGCTIHAGVSFLGDIGK